MSRSYAVLSGQENFQVLLPDQCNVGMVCRERGCACVITASFLQVMRGNLQGAVI